MIHQRDRLLVYCRVWNGSQGRRHWDFGPIPFWQADKGNVGSPIGQRMKRPTGAHGLQNAVTSYSLGHLYMRINTSYLYIVFGIR